MDLEQLAERYEETGRLPVIYVAGPMSGYPEFNFPAFNAVARKLRLFGFPVLNPADFGEGMSELDEVEDSDTLWTLAMQRDLPLVAAADCVVLLPGWAGSRGATMEYEVASQFGKECVSFADAERAIEFLSAFFTPDEAIRVVDADNFAESAREAAMNRGGEDLLIVAADPGAEVTLAGLDAALAAYRKGEAA